MPTEEPTPTEQPPAETPAAETPAPPVGDPLQIAADLIASAGEAMNEKAARNGKWQPSPELLIAYADAHSLFALADATRRQTSSQREAAAAVCQLLARLPAGLAAALTGAGQQQEDTGLVVARAAVKL